MSLCGGGDRSPMAVEPGLPAGCSIWQGRPKLPVTKRTKCLGQVTASHEGLPACALLASIRAIGVLWGAYIMWAFIKRLQSLLAGHSNYRVKAVCSEDI